MLIFNDRKRCIPESWGILAVLAIRLWCHYSGRQPSSGLSRGARAQTQMDGWMDAQEQALCSLLLLYPAWCFSFGRGPWLKTGEWDAGKKHLENIQTASQLYSAENITPPRVIGSKLNGTWKAMKHAPCFLHLNQARDGNIQPSFGVGIWNRVSCG